MPAFDEKKFFLFGMGMREKLFYSSGVLRKIPSGEVVFAYEIESDEIIPWEYRVDMRTKSGRISLYENEEGVFLDRGEESVSALTTGKLRLPAFADHPYRNALRLLHHDILINIVDGKPVPNLFVYDRPWYRDGAMMTMVLEKTGNLHLIKEWAKSLDDLYDRNNKGVEESDNLGQLLYILAKTGNTSHDLIPKAVEEAKKRCRNGALTGLSDYSEHPVYQTKWMIFGLHALGLDASWLTVPNVEDSYADLFWMDGHKSSAGAGKYDAKYPYLTWARAHSNGFSMEKEYLDALMTPEYPISLETKASEAKYEKERAFLPSFAENRHASPHTWHASEMFLYLYDDHLMNGGN